MQQDSSMHASPVANNSNNSTTAMPMTADAAIGIFDSGVGGLSVLRHVHAALPCEHLLYFADSGFAPYGERSTEDIVTRSLAVAGFLQARGCKALVVACNTATAAAIHAIRARWPQWTVIGVEPGLKPAAQQTRNGKIGVLATRSTLASPRFAQLRLAVEAQPAPSTVVFLPQACVGLVELVEKGELYSPATFALLERYLTPLLAQDADTLVLGCTHYPFVREAIEACWRRLGGQACAIVDTGEAVTRQLQRLLHAQGLLATSGQGIVSGYTTASQSGLQHAFATLLKLRPEVHALAAQA